MKLHRAFYELYRGVGSFAMRVGANNVSQAKRAQLTTWMDALVHRLVAPGIPSTYSVDGMKLTFPHEGYFGMEVSSGSYEPKTTRIFRQLLHPGMTVVDVGAHVGYYTLVAATMLKGNGHVVAFEPDPTTFAFLQQNIRLNNVTTPVALLPKAVSNTTGGVNLFIGRRDRVANSIFPTESVSTTAVPTQSITLDDFFKQAGWPPVDLIKIDVEGAELAVLQGMPELSARNPSLKLIMEFFPSNLKAVGVEPQQFFNTLHDLGFNKVAMIFDQLEPLDLPADIPLLLRRCGPAFVNLLCEKAV